MQNLRVAKGFLRITPLATDLLSNVIMWMLKCLTNKLSIKSSEFVTEGRYFGLLKYSCKHASVNTNNTKLTKTERYLDEGELSDFCCANVMIFSTQRSSSCPGNCILRPHISSNIASEVASMHKTSPSR